MADTTGKDTPATDPKNPGQASDASGVKTGPVRPPVLEGTARPAAAPGSGDTAKTSSSKTDPTKTAGGRTEAPVDTPPRPKAPVAETGGNSSTPWLAGVVGGLLGLGAAYGLAWFGLWPLPPQAPPPADPRLAQFASAIPELETVTGTVQDELSTLTGRVGALEAELGAQPAATPAMPDPALAEELAALAIRVDEIAVVAGESRDAGPAEESLSQIQSELEALRARTETTTAQLSEAQRQIDELVRNADDMAGAEAATARLPLIFSGLESAFAAGRSFETELAALRRALPETLVPEAIAGRAATGLPQPEDVERRLLAALPAMLAGRPRDAEAGWQETTADWFRGLIAMRPAGNVEGDGPDAIIARLESAIARRDFVAADAEMASLPGTMASLAGTVADDIASLATAEAFLAQLRSRALSGEDGA